MTLAPLMPSWSSYCTSCNFHRRPFRSLCSRYILADAGVPDHLQKVVSDTWSGTWFGMRDLQEIVLTHKGSRPGDPTADLLFGFVMAKYLQMAESRLLEDGVLQYAATPIAIPGREYERAYVHGFTTWADDTAVMLEDADIEVLLRKVQVTVATCLESACFLGMELNFTKGKSEVVLQLRGDGVQQHRRSLYCTDNPTLAVSTVVGPIQVHLGGIIHEDASCKAELAWRVAVASGATKSFRKFYTDKRYPLKTRCQVYESLTLSRLHFNQHTWEPLG